jgi:hypothetical protein
MVLPELVKSNTEKRGWRTADPGCSLLPPKESCPAPPPSPAEGGESLVHSRDDSRHWANGFFGRMDF